MPSTVSPRPDVPLAAKVAFLCQPGSFPDRPQRVEAIETHMSWVFLTERHAYKLKKPVCMEFLDFRTLAARQFYCNEELRLNRRLSTGVYLGVVGLSLDALGQLHIEHDPGGLPGEERRIVDWLVQMRRLPARWMLDYAIRNGALRDDDIRRVVRHLAAFYASCKPASIDASGYRAAFLREIDRTHRILVQPAYGLSSDAVPGLCERQRAMLRSRHELFDSRVLAGKVVEGHGDLRPEHVCLRPKIAIIDCLDFSAALRMVDPVDELAYLALECERLGLADASVLVLDAYRGVSTDRPDMALVYFYQGFRALVRAGIAIRHLDEERYRPMDKWRRRAADYLQMAGKFQRASESVIEPPA